MQNKNLKLKLGLCGLALTSFLALNARTTVHADTVQNNNADNNAITWDSDSDDSQVVKEEPQQQTAPQSVQKQSTVQASQSQPVQNKKMMVSDVSSTSVSQKRAETSDVRQSNTDVYAVNRLNADNKTVKVANVNATDPIKITNPQNNQVVVHYVKTNGQAVFGVQDTVINTSVSGNGNYEVPKGYSLTKNGYTIQHTIPDPQSIYTWTFRVSDAGPNSISMSGSDAKPTKDPNSGLWTGAICKTFTVPQETIDELNNVLKTHYNTQVEPGDFIEFPMETDESDDNGKHSYYIDYAVYHKASDNDEWYSNSKSSPFNGVFYFKGTESDIEDHSNKWDPSLNSISVGNLDSSLKSYILHTAKSMKMGDQWNRIVIGDPAKSSVFIDNSGQVKSVVGNHINLQITKPVSVNDASQTRKTAERIISVNLPDDKDARKRYEGILNGNNQIVQTITFTRTMTKDDLTGAILSQSAWQGPSSFPAVTLPDIPGYTITMS